MADFVQTMKDWKRMCNKYFDGKNLVCSKTCPMYAFEVCSKPTAKYPVPLEIGQDLAQKIDCVITAWAKDNLEPVYPSWWEYLHSIGVLYKEHTEGGDETEICWGYMMAPIPADKAKKLGLKPKNE